MTKNYTEHLIKDKNFHTFYIKFDLADDGTISQTKEEFYDELMDDLVVFAFGPKINDINIHPKEYRKYLKKAAFKFYEVNPQKDFKRYYSNRGEFGELILYHLLSEYFNSEPLISKIYFKDTKNVPAHGYDSVHIDTEKKVMWLGESKLYSDYNSAFVELKDDLDKHFRIDFLNAEFETISNRLDDLDKQPKFVQKILDENTRKLDKLVDIKVALFAGFTSSVFDDYDIKTFKDKLNKKIDIWIKNANKKFSSHPWYNNLDIYLLMFPLDDKDKLVKRLHEKLGAAQKI